MLRWPERRSFSSAEIQGDRDNSACKLFLEVVGDYSCPVSGDCCLLSADKDTPSTLHVKVSTQTSRTSCRRFLQNAQNLAGRKILFADSIYPASGQGLLRGYCMPSDLAAFCAVSA